MTFVTLSLRYAGPRIGVGWEFCALLRGAAQEIPQTEIRARIGNRIRRACAHFGVEAVHDDEGSGAVGSDRDAGGNVAGRLRHYNCGTTFGASSCSSGNGGLNQGNGSTTKGTYLLIADAGGIQGEVLDPTAKTISITPGFGTVSTPGTNNFR